MTGPTALTRLPVGQHPARWRRFERAHTQRIAAELSEVEPLVHQAERLAHDGSWVLLMLSYEAAPALDPTLIAHPPGALPLAWMAAFDQPHDGEPPASPDSLAVGPWDGLDSRTHADAYARIVEAIRAGETYQVNYSLRMRAPCQGDAHGVFAALARAQPTSGSMYLDLGRHAVCSVSPELFFSRSGSELRTMPMKGTAPRHADPARDAAAARGLRASAKDVAENVMIVDLLRNDLARVSRPGTVRVSNLCAVQSLPTLHTMTSTVCSEVTPGMDLVDILRALFPCGSVTGAPKASTMRLIRDLERSPRGVYCGALGLLAPGGDATFTVPIRTAVVDRARSVVEYGVGSGITIASTAEAEFAEVQTKARVLDALAPAVRS